MPGPEDYPYIDPEGPQEIAHAVPEVSQADSNPAFYPPEQKSEALLTEDEKKYLDEQKAADEAKTGDEDVVTGDGEVFVPKEQAEAPLPAEVAAEGRAEAKEEAAETPQPTAKGSVPKAKKD